MYDRRPNLLTGRRIAKEEVLVLASANMANAKGTYIAMFKIKKDINAILESEDFHNDVIDRQALIGNNVGLDN